MGEKDFPLHDGHGGDETLNGDEASAVRAAWLRRKETATLDMKPTDAL